MEPSEKIRLYRQTADALGELCRYDDNWRSVPEGKKLQWLDSDGEWRDLEGDVYQDSPSTPRHIRLVDKYKYRRFTLSTNPLGLLDMQRPGKICLADPGATVGDMERTLKATDKHLSSDIYAWSDLEVPLGPDDIPPRSVFMEMDAPECAWVSCTSCSCDGVNLVVRFTTWQELYRDFLIKRPGEDWKPCRKAAK